MAFYLYFSPQTNGSRLTSNISREAVYGNPYITFKISFFSLIDQQLCGQFKRKLRTDRQHQEGHLRDALEVKYYQSERHNSTIQGKFGEAQTLGDKGGEAGEISPLSVSCTSRCQKMKYVEASATAIPWPCTAAGRAELGSVAIAGFCWLFQLLP